MNALARRGSAAERRSFLLLSSLLALGACAPAAGPAARPTPADAVEIGYGAVARERVTGAVSTLREEDFGGRPVTRVEELLEGRFPGVSVRRVGSGYSVRIRGTATLMGSGEPLYVIDGLPMFEGSRPLDGINPADVARIEVLRDASATAIYGSRGANGVIVLTLKKAR